MIIKNFVLNDLSTASLPVFKIKTRNWDSLNFVGQAN